MKTVIIEYDNEGNCSIDGKGFGGPECGRYLKELQVLLGEQISSNIKPEYSQRTTCNRGTQKVGE